MRPYTIPRKFAAKMRGHKNRSAACSQAWCAETRRTRCVDSIDATTGRCGVRPRSSAEVDDGSLAGNSSRAVARSEEDRQRGTCATMPKPLATTQIFGCAPRYHVGRRGNGPSLGVRHERLHAAGRVSMSMKRSFMASDLPGERLAVASSMIDHDPRPPSEIPISDGGRPRWPPPTAPCRVWPLRGAPPRSRGPGR